MFKRLTAAIILAAGILAVPLATSANAAPSNCSAGKVTSDAHGYWASCTSGSGQFRAKARCDKSLAPDYDDYSPWTSLVGTAVIGDCNSGDRAFNVTYQVR